MINGTIPNPTYFANNNATRASAGVAASEPAPAAEQNDDEEAVSLAQRALPLIELLRAAAKAKVNVMWDKNS